jgi:glyoxylase-like metal-dependent hydrolase (beta-lactamase superfamily II)
VAVVDAGRTKKVPALLRALDADLGLSVAAEAFMALVVATHSHDDHMAGLPELLTAFRGDVAELWDPGYYHTIGAYHGAMTAIESVPADDVLYDIRATLRRITLAAAPLYS